MLSPRKNETTKHNTRLLKQWSNWRFFLPCIYL